MKKSENVLFKAEKWHEQSWEAPNQGRRGSLLWLKHLRSGGGLEEEWRDKDTRPGSLLLKSIAYCIKGFRLYLVGNEGLAKLCK